MLIGCDLYLDIVTGDILNQEQGAVAMNSIYG